MVYLCVVVGRYEIQSAASCPHPLAVVAVDDDALYRDIVEEIVGIVGAVVAWHFVLHDAPHVAHDILLAYVVWPVLCREPYVAVVVLGEVVQDVYVAQGVVLVGELTVVIKLVGGGVVAVYGCCLSVAVAEEDAVVAS